MTIGALGQATGVGAETIRYYERIELLPQPARTSGGYRVYRPEHVRRLNFIRRSRELDLSIEGVRELLSLASDRLRPCARVDRLVRDHIHDLDHKIESLQKLRGALQRLADSCRGGGRVSSAGSSGLQEAEETLAGPDIECGPGGLPGAPRQRQQASPRAPRLRSFSGSSQFHPPRPRYRWRHAPPRARDRLPRPHAGLVHV